jgi:hypothetical protein
LAPEIGGGKFFRQFAGGLQEQEQDDGDPVGGVDPEEAPDEESPPVPALGVEIQVDAEAADDKEQRHAALAHGQGEKDLGEGVVGKIPEPAVPLQVLVAVNRGIGMAEHHQQNGDAAQLVEQIETLQGILHLVRLAWMEFQGSKAGVHRAERQQKLARVAGFSADFAEGRRLGIF